MIPARGLLLVRPIETHETMPGGRVILTADARERLTANQCEVLAVGAFAACDDEDCERTHRTLCEDAQCDGCGCAEVRVHMHDACVGDWLLVTPRSFVEGPEPERKEWFVHQDAIMAIFDAEGT